MNNNIFLKISKFLVYLVPFAVVIVYQGTLFPFIVGKYTFFRAITLLALIFFVWGWATSKSQKFKVESQKFVADRNIFNGWSFLSSSLAVAIAIFVFIFLLSGFFGYSPHSSFWSNFERGEGGLQIICLFIFFALLAILFRDEESWLRIFAVSIWASILVIAYGVAAALRLDNFIGAGFCERFAGSLGNPAYLGTLMIFSLFFSGYLFVKAKKPLKKCLLAGSILIFLLSLFLSQTRGAFLGLGAGILFGLSYLVIYLSGRKRLIPLLILIALIVGGSLVFVNRHSINLMWFCGAKANNRLLDVSPETENFQTRLLLWRQSLLAFAERPILGWGPESFSIAFEKHFDVRFTAWFDRAHNIFFDYLVFSGILGLMSFIGVFVVFYLQFFKRTRIITNYTQTRIGSQRKSVLSPFESMLVFSLPIAYLVQGFVLFDVLPIYINLFLFLGFAAYRLQVVDAEKHAK